LSDRQAQNVGTTAVAETHRFDEARLDLWLRENIAGYEGNLTVVQFKGGQSNPTYQLITPHNTYVLRRKPPGVLLENAHAVDREYRVIQALHAAGFPVARPYALCKDYAVIGTWFYVMAMVDGRSIWDTSFPGVSREKRPEYFSAMNETIAHLHRIDFTAIGLGDYGKPGKYIERQIHRWTRQYREDTLAGRDVHMDRLAEWLPQNVPPGDETRLSHGDYRCDNLIFHPTEARVIAVLDWELSTLGHPIADFAFHAMIYRMPPDLLTGLAGMDLGALNIPSEQSYIQLYCERTSRSGLESYEFYIAFNMFRLAAILHGIKGRIIRGTASSAHARQVAGLVEPLARLAWAQVAA
jgi:aminoglycoside phosphotransferase (APT) family kinase protein